MPDTAQLSITDAQLQPVKPVEYQSLFSTAQDQLKNLPLDIELLFVDADAMQTLNNEATGNDYPTDVLSYNFAENHAVLSHEVAAQVVICPSVAAQNAKKASVSPEAELKTLFVHGLVHISGLDHGTKLQKAQFDTLVSGIIETSYEKN